MLRFYFRIEGDAAHDETEAVELDSVAEAQCEAVRFAGRVICDRAGEFWNSGDWKMTVTDHNGLSLFTLQLIGTESPAIRAAAPPRPTSASPPP